MAAHGNDVDRGDQPVSGRVAFVQDTSRRPPVRSAPMQESSLVSLAVPPTATVVREITPDRFDAPTPCHDWTVGHLVAHLLEWGPALEAAARKEVVDPAAVDPDTGRLEAQLGRLVAAWSRPDAWTGVTRLGGPMELPASMIGGMVLGEVVVHGWDLARATARSPVWPADLLGFVHAELAKTADMGREMGVYGAAVPVPDDAPVLDRILGLTGRDPGWRGAPSRTDRS
jgi:uncharacterized protein (TIGR03086 family)